MLDALLVVAPFGDLDFPSIGAGLLAASAQRSGFRCRVEYASIAFAEEIGIDAYRLVSSGLRNEALAGEFIFASAVFGNALPDPARYVREILGGSGPSDWVARMVLAAREKAAAFLERAAAAILAHGAGVVGFSSAFHQTCASVALAQRLKRSGRPPLVVFGGANCEAGMGLALLRSFDCIDAVANGESEESFVELLRRVRDGAWDPASPPAGMATRRRPEVTEPRRLAMDDLPVPDFDDYFGRLGASKLCPEVQGGLMVETARGCWWGEKHHCTFCGLNGSTMAFRSKSPGRAFDEIAGLSRRYGRKRMNVVDNILDPGYLRTLVPRLAEANLGLELFYEVKSNLRFEQLSALRAAGVHKLQPGIESFSDEVLRLMRKGCSGAQNIQLLRWGAELGIGIAYNLLCGFPGESDAAYREMLELLPLLEHLEPPTGVSQIRLDRFSPFFADPQAFGISRVRPARAYFYVYPFARTELMELAYHFEFDHAEEPAGPRHLPRLRAAQEEWRSSRGVLAVSFGQQSAVVRDGRRCATAPEHRLDPLEATILWSCDRARDPHALFDSPLGADRVERAVRRLASDKLLHLSGRHVLCLPVFQNRDEARQRPGPHAPAPPKAALALALVG